MRPSTRGSATVRAYNATAIAFVTRVLCLALLPATRRHDLPAASSGLRVLSAHAHAPEVADTAVGAVVEKETAGWVSADRVTNINIYQHKNGQECSSPAQSNKEGGNTPGPTQTYHDNARTSQDELCFRVCDRERSLPVTRQKGLQVTRSGFARLRPTTA